MVTLLTNKETEVQKAYVTFPRHLIRRSLRHQFLPPPIRIYLPYSSKRCKVKIHKSTWRFCQPASLVTLKYSPWIRSISRLGRRTVILTLEEAQGCLYEGLVFSSWLNCSDAQISCGSCTQSPWLRQYPQKLRLQHRN